MDRDIPYSERSDLVSSLGQLIEQRYHGAKNIGGIRFQVLYAVLCGLEFYKDGTSFAIHLEGLEDLDIHLPQEQKYIQIKTAEKPWHWGKLGHPIRSFAEVGRAAPAGTFMLVFCV